MAEGCDVPGRPECEYAHHGVQPSSSPFCEEESSSTNRFTSSYIESNNLTLVVEDIQRKARDLLLRDMMAAGEEAVPPQYEKLVERYFEVLSRERESE